MTSDTEIGLQAEIHRLEVKNERLRQVISELGEYASDLPGGSDRTAFEAVVNAVAKEKP